MIDFKQYIEDKTKVYSVEHGVGKVISIFRLYDGVFDYFEVQFDEGNLKKYFPMRTYENNSMSAHSILLV